MTALDHRVNVLDGLSRARTLLLEHTVPAASVTVLTSGRVDVRVEATHTFSEELRRHAVDVLATAAHLEHPIVVGDEYATSNPHWRIATPVKAGKCPQCGGDR